MMNEHQTTPDEDMDRVAMYREIQRAVPGLDTIYRFAEALIAGQPSAAPRVLVAGAGGGREIEAFGAGVPTARITAVDPSASNLATAKLVAGPTKNVRFVEGRLEDLRSETKFDVVTSLLVMHHLPDDGAKLAYLRAIRDRLSVGGVLIHADICLEDPDELERLAPIYRAHAQHVGAAPEAMRLELRTIPELPIIPQDRVRELFAQADLAAPREVFRSLWYRCWISEHTPIPRKGRPT